MFTVATLARAWGRPRSGERSYTGFDVYLQIPNPEPRILNPEAWTLFLFLVL